MYLNRLTGFDHQCRVRYTIVLGDNDRRLDSGIVDDVSDTDGRGYGWHPRTRFNDLVYKVGGKAFPLMYDAASEIDRRAVCREIP